MSPPFATVHDRDGHPLRVRGAFGARFRGSEMFGFFVIAVRPSAPQRVQSPHAKRQWGQSEQRNPAIGDRQREERRYSTHRRQNADSGELSHDHGSRSKRAIREEGGQEQDVVDVGRGEDRYSYPDNNHPRSQSTALT